MTFRCGAPSLLGPSVQNPLPSRRFELAFDPDRDQDPKTVSQQAAPSASASDSPRIDD